MKLGLPTVVGRVYQKEDFTPLCGDHGTSGLCHGLRYHCETNCSFLTGAAIDSRALLSQVLYRYMFIHDSYTRLQERDWI